MKSIMQGQKRCLICRSPYVEKHHVFGAANRQNSEKYGLTVWLCHKHHNEPPEGVHFNRRFIIVIVKRTHQFTENTCLRHSA